VINLRGSILQRKGHVIHQVVVRSCEMLPDATSKQCFAAILKRVRTVSSKGIAHGGSEQYVDECGQTVCGFALSLASDLGGR
jgi:hypothetical protein